MRTIRSLDEAKQLVSQEVGVSDWIEVTQERINRFSDSSDDHQWIHIDVARAKSESPYGGTIAHGFLTLSLLSSMLAATVRLELGGKMNINYGLNRVRFPNAVPAGARVRGRLALQKIEEMRGCVQFTWGATVEVEGSAKPCVV